MSNKQRVKEKKKLLKLKQKETTLKNKGLKEISPTKTELLSIDKYKIPDIEDKIELSGSRGYVIKLLKDVIDDLISSEIDDVEIQFIARFLIKFAETPISMHNELLKVAKVNLSDNKKHSIGKNNINLNITERALIKNRMQGVLMEYGSKDVNKTNIDYSGIRVFFEMLYRLILVGLEENKILSINLYLGYSDTICDMIVEYANNTSKYNIYENTFIDVIWNPMDDLYNTYTIYKNTYKNFNDTSLQSLATASAAAKEYESRENGKEIISYNGIVLNYVGVLEFELKKLISVRFNLNKKKLKLVDAINSLSKTNNPLLSDPELLDSLHRIRLLRNKVAHGDSITRDEYIYIKTILLSNKTLEYINGEFVNSNTVSNNQSIIDYQIRSESPFYYNNVELDYKESIKWYTTSANQGDLESQMLLGAMYDTGQLVTQSPKKAIKWYTKAANQGNIHAQYILGTKYYYGDSVKKDYKESIKWYTKAANQGDIHAQMNLGSMYYRGIEIKQDYKKALKWIEEAARLGHPEAQLNLGCMYSSGELVTTNYEEAIKWYTKSADQGNSEAQILLSSLLSALTSENIN